MDNVDPVADLPLDAGIRRYVLALRSRGIQTFESCEGGPDHAFTEPTIKFHGDFLAGFEAFAVAMECGLPIYKLRLVYSIDDGVLYGPWWEMLFVTPDLATNI